MAEAAQRLLAVLDDYANFLRGRELALPKHQPAGGDEAKYWLDPVQLTANYGFNVRELTEIARLVDEYRDQLLEAWNEHLG